MKLREGFMTHTAAGTQYLVPVGSTKFSGLVRSNATAAMIVDALAQDTTPEAITELLLARYDAPRERIAADVARILDTLRQIGALDE